jgi:hypothetical protein
LGGPGKRKEDQELRALHVLQASIVSKKRKKKKKDLTGIREKVFLTK